uniref:Ankyrin repeat domain-containing protein 11-like n=2 Tax=Hirondellea gigas TaxID=1518452 RepID=A0A2P2HX24_9CRUS
MVRPVHSKRKLFDNSKEQKENTTPNEQLDKLSINSSQDFTDSNNSSTLLKPSSSSKSCTDNCHSTTNNNNTEQKNKFVGNTGAGNEDLPVSGLVVTGTAGTCSSAINNPSAKTSRTGVNHTPSRSNNSKSNSSNNNSTPQHGRSSNNSNVWSPAGVGSVNSSPHPRSQYNTFHHHTMPMSERQQIALLMQMSSPSPPSKCLSHNSSSNNNNQYSTTSSSITTSIGSPRCNSPYSPHNCGAGPHDSPALPGANTQQHNYPSMASGRGGGICKRNERGETPLHVAAIRGDADRVQQLIARGSDVNAVDYAGWTALHEACNRGFVSVARELISAGALVNAKGLDNDTPLHDACVNNHFKIVELLLESGASTSVVNRRGETPGDVCRSSVILGLLHKAPQYNSGITESSIVKANDNSSKMSRRTPPSNKLDTKIDIKLEPKTEKEECKNEESNGNNNGGGGGNSSTSNSNGSGNSSSSGGSSIGTTNSSQNPNANSAQPSGASNTGHASSNSNVSSSTGGSSDPSSPRVTLRLTPTSTRTPDKTARTSTEIKCESSDDPYEFKFNKDEGGISSTSPTANGGNNREGTNSPAASLLLSVKTEPGSNDITDNSNGSNKRPAEENDDDEAEQAKKKKKEESSKDNGAAVAATASSTSGKVTNRGGEKTTKGGAQASLLSSSMSQGFNSMMNKSNSGSSDGSSPSSGANNSSPSSNSSSYSTATSNTSSTSSSTLAVTDSSRKSLSSSIMNSPKTSIKQEKCEDTSDDESSRHDSSNITGGGGSGGGPKVPPLKIVLSSCGGGSSSTSNTSSQEQEHSSGQQNNKNINSRHVPYVVTANQGEGKEEIACSIGGTGTSVSGATVSTSAAGGTAMAGSSTVDNKDATGSGVKEEPMSPGSSSTSGEKSAPRITRSQRGTGSADECSAAVKMEVKAEDAVVSSSSSCASTSASYTSTLITSTSSANNAEGAQHPRKRKLNIKEEELEAQQETMSEQPVPNCYQMFVKIRKQIDERRKLLFPVQPKPPQGFKDYLMNRGTYILAGNPSSQHSVPIAAAPATLTVALKEIFTEQEKDRYKLRLHHQIEREKLVLSVEQDILRVHGKAARALANQVLPFSACTMLRDQEVYNILTPEQEEKHRNARSRYNGRLFISWLQDVDDKWEKIKEGMVLRHQHEAESLNAVHRMDWEWKMKELGLCDNKSKPVIEEIHVPMVAVPDFDLLPA